MAKTRNATRNARIYMDYHGINESHERVPAIVLASRYGLTRGRIYQIVGKEESKRQANNPRIVFKTESVEKDAKLVSSMLIDLLGAL